MMEMMIKAAVTCIVVSLMALVLKGNTPELALLLTLAAVVSVMAAALSFYEEIRELLGLILQQTGLDESFFVPVLKIIAISFVSRLGSDICQDSGQKALSTVMELAGIFCALVTAAPLLQTVLAVLLDLGG